MERIIIREVDNTSNVEQLSSYDVVYVPGFAPSPDSKYFRNPTLFTSKYQFLRAFNNTEGSTAAALPPTFEYDQPYPVATATTKGFPTYAIPYYSKTEIVSEDNGIVLSEFDNYNVFDNYYEHVDIVAPESDGEPDPTADWEPSVGVNYFLMTSDANEHITVRYSTLPLGENQTYVEIYGEQGSNNVYVSKVNPRELGWYEKKPGSDVLTSDTQIGYEYVDGVAVPKTYYGTIQTTPPMFYGGDPDPGYRYALYLLSLGIPVYFEVMNMAEAEPIDITSDFTSALVRYGTAGEEGERAIDPEKNGWYYDDGTGIKKFTNADPSDPLLITTETQALQLEMDWYMYADISLDSMYAGLENRFMSDPAAPDYSFDSMGDYSIKYISSGGYPTFEYGLLEDGEVKGSSLAYAMMELAERREDAVALIDHTNNPERSIYATDELSVSFKVREEMSNYSSDVTSYGAMFTPWYSCTHSAIVGTTDTDNVNIPFMPASLAFLSALAVQLRNYNPWLAVSGVTRGKVPYFGSLHTNQLLTNNVADSYQSVPQGAVSEGALVSINPITYIRQYGYCIWGNRTLRNNSSGTKATSFLNIRNLVSDIKKKLYEASERLLFEQNTDILWLDFKHIVSPLLDTMVSNNILSDYNMVKYNIDPESGEPVPAYMVLAHITIRPINSVEVFDLTVILENNEISVAETE